MAMIPCEYDGGGIKSTSFSGQTAPTGSLALQTPWDGKRMPLFAKESNGYRCIFFVNSSNGLYMQLYTTNSTNTQVIPVSGVSVSGTYYYIDNE